MSEIPSRLTKVEILNKWTLSLHSWKIDHFLFSPAIFIVFYSFRERIVEFSLHMLLKVLILD